MNKRIVGYMLGVSLLAVPGLSLAVSTASINASSLASYSEEELVVMIAKLQKQLEEVRKNNVQCALADVDLSIGDGEGDNLKDHVKSLQAFLKEKGYITVEPTGYFGKLTRAGLMAYQKSAGLAQNGELNASVRATMKDLKCRKNYMIQKAEYKKEYKETVKSSTPVTSIKLMGEGSKVKWMTEGYSKNGFKIVWSKNPTPAYPTRDGDKYIYLSEPSAYTTNLEAFSGSGTYYVRVCEYLGGACGIYSNEITLNL